MLPQARLIEESAQCRLEGRRAGGRNQKAVLTDHIGQRTTGASHHGYTRGLGLHHHPSELLDPPGRRYRRYRQDVDVSIDARNPLLIHNAVEGDTVRYSERFGEVDKTVQLRACPEDIDDEAIVAGYRTEQYVDSLVMDK